MRLRFVQLQVIILRACCVHSILKIIVNAHRPVPALVGGFKGGQSLTDLVIYEFVCTFDPVKVETLQ